MSLNSGEQQDPDMKLLLKAMVDQIKLLNARLDDLQSPSKSRLPKGQLFEDDSDDGGSSTRRRKMAWPSYEETLMKIKAERERRENTSKPPMEEIRCKNDEDEIIICEPEQEYDWVDANNEEINHVVEVIHEDHLLPLELASKEASLKEEEVVVHEEIRAIMEEEKVLVHLEVQRVEEEKEIEDEDVSYVSPISNIDFVFPNDFFDVSLTKFQIFQVLQMLEFIKEERWQFCMLLILLLHHSKTRGRVFSNKACMIHTREASSLVSHDAIPWSLIRGRILSRREGMIEIKVE